MDFCSASVSFIHHSQKTMQFISIFLVNWQQCYCLKWYVIQNFQFKKKIFQGFVKSLNVTNSFVIPMSDMNYIEKADKVQ